MAEEKTTRISIYDMSRKDKDWIYINNSADFEVKTKGMSKEQKLEFFNKCVDDLHSAISFALENGFSFQNSVMDGWYAFGFMKIMADSIIEKGE